MAAPQSPDPDRRRPPTVVVWDLGNVLIPWDRRRALAQAIADPAEVERVAEEVFTLEVNGHLDSGVELTRIAELVERDNPGSGWIIGAYVENFEHSLGEVIAGSAALLEALVAAGVRCVGLSNWGSNTFRGVPQRYPVLGLLEGIVISGELGVGKPHPEAFRHCEQRFGFAPGDALFIDDNEPNVAAALALGWDAVQFTDPDTLGGDLRARGLAV